MKKKVREEKKRVVERRKKLWEKNCEKIRKMKEEGNVMKECKVKRRKWEKGEECENGKKREKIGCLRGKVNEENWGKKGRKNMKMKEIWRKYEREEIGEIGR